MPTALAPVLTKRQFEIVEFIEKCLRDPTRRFPPTVREIAEAVGLSSTSSVHYQLRAIERAGVLIRVENHSRAITIVKSALRRAREAAAFDRDEAA